MYVSVVHPCLTKNDRAVYSEVGGGGGGGKHNMCFLERMYKLPVYHYITSVHPSLRYSLCFSGVFLSTIGLQYIPLLKQKQKS